MTVVHCSEGRTPGHPPRAISSATPPAPPKFERLRPSPNLPLWADRPCNIAAKFRALYCTNHKNIVHVGGRDEQAVNQPKQTSRCALSLKLDRRPLLIPACPRAVQTAGQ
ncbi:hypothetical protein EVAR_68083_1 [Eumeta japonica]|uniref:Uncharacterized protein n=1 Tax=Eumeta variegata TaxID=151549 RepID=A0A4C1ZQK2_EUMVA|nr:hypothetical protein EVAR_68083_1 [Eumeta japonica]